MKVIETGKKDKWEVIGQAMADGAVQWRLCKGTTAVLVMSSNDGFTREDAQALCDRKNGEATEKWYVRYARLDKKGDPESGADLISEPLAIITGDLSQIEGPWEVDTHHQTGAFLITNNLGRVFVLDECHTKVVAEEIRTALNLLHQLRQ